MTAAIIRRFSDVRQIRFDSAFDKERLSGSHGRFPLKPAAFDRNPAAEGGFGIYRSKRSLGRRMGRGAPVYSGVSLNFTAPKPIIPPAMMELRVSMPRRGRPRAIA
ncbi:MAG: hypothetical protein GY862_06725 [Gammaproteobacteria bacterium]|nr:hypothetical protein [Gammaproteobacteria bacterium]